MLLKKNPVKTILFLFFLGFSLLFSAHLIKAESNPEKKGGERTIAVVYHQPTALLFSSGDFYQFFVKYFQRQWERLAEQHGFNLMVLRGGTGASSEIALMRTMTTQGVDGVLSCYLDPVLSVSVIDELHAAGIPVVAHGTPPPSEVEIPYVGIDDYKASFELGRETALLFTTIYGADEPKIMISNNRAIPVNQMREEGFLNGFYSALPDAEVVARSEDDGSIRGADMAIRTDLLMHPEVNVVFGTNDHRAHVALATLESMGRGTLETEIVAGFGGSILAMREVMERENAWRVQLAISFKELSELSYTILQRMIDGELPMRNTDEYIVDPYIFINPKKQEVEDYIDAHFEVEDFEQAVTQKM